MEVNLSFKELVKIGFKSHNLSKADLNEARLSGANLHETDLSGAALHKSDLSGTDLRGIPWLTIMELTLQPSIVWKNVLYDWTAEDEG